MHRPQPPVTALTPRLSLRAPGLRLLVTEDGQDNRALLQHYLRGEPVTVQFAENGQAAVDLVLGGSEFDLILMDLDKSVLDCHAATSKIRELQTSRGLPPTPIVALSAHAVPDLVRDSLEAGYNAHIAKPVEREVLINTLYRYTVLGHVAKLLEQTGHDTPEEELAPEIAALVPQYLASISRQMEEAHGRLSEHDVEPIRRFGHNLKGTGRGYGFPPLEHMGRALEAAAASGEEEHIAEQLEFLRQFLNRAPVTA